MLKVAIVGAGLAGLTAARELGQIDGAVFEQYSRAGGRIYTNAQNGIYYDLGALFAYDPKRLPFETPLTPLIREDDAIGLLSNGLVHRGRSIDECLASLPDNTVNANFLASLIFTETLAYSSEQVRSLANSLFTVIHSAEITQYAPSIQMNAICRFSPSHYLKGNGQAVDSLLADLRLPVNYGCTLEWVEERNDRVSLTFNKRGQLVQLECEYLLLATTADKARELLPAIAIEHCEPTRLARYGSFTVVVIAMSPPVLKEYSYVITKDGPMNSMFKQKVPNHNVSLLIAYYGDRDWTRTSALGNTQLYREVLASAKQIDENVANSTVLFTDLHRWRVGGTIISSDLLSACATQPSLRVSNRIFVAGDYLDHEHPYGMAAAARSGVRAGREVAATIATSRQESRCGH